MSLLPPLVADVHSETTFAPKEPPPAADRPNSRPKAPITRATWGRGLVVFLLAALAVPTGLGLYADFRDVSATLTGFRWALMPALIALTLANYLVRYLRWRNLLRISSGHSPGLWQDLLVFFAGTAMILTPARLGEWTKSYYARERYGAPVARTAPIMLAERVGDCLAMLLLSSAGLVVFGWGRPIFVLVIAMAAAAIVAFRHRGLASTALRWLRRFHATRRLVPSIEEFHDSARLLFSARGMSWALGLGLVAWSLECLMFFLVLVGLGRPATAELALQASFIFPIATLAGGLALLPAGIGVTEGSITGMVQAIVGAPRSLAVASALLARALILGFALALGLPALALVGRTRDSRKVAAPVLTKAVSPN